MDHVRTAHSAMYYAIKTARIIKRGLMIFIAQKKKVLRKKIAKKKLCAGDFIILNRTNKGAEMLKKTRKLGDKMEKMYERIKERHGGMPVCLGEVCTGIASEGGEVVEEWRKYNYESKPLYNGNIVNEMADVLHYLILGCVYYGFDLEDLAKVNAAKMDAIEEGERVLFDDFIEDWEPEQETINQRLERWEKVARKLRERRECNGN